MMSTTNLFVITSILWCMLSGTVVSFDKCQSPQYLQLGEKKGMISCNVPDGSYGAYWYYSTDLSSNDRPFISLEEGIKSGPGYESGEFNILPNGSLLINEVSTQHDNFFGLATLATTDDDPILEDVRVVVYDKPPEPYPTINATGCVQKSFCFLELSSASRLSCNVLRVGEALYDLSWKLRTNTGDGQIPSQSKSVTTSVNELQSYYTVVDISLKPSLSLRLLVCASRSNVSEVGNTEFTILVESGTLESSSEPLLVTPNERVVMNCGEDVLFFVWKKVGQTEETIAFGTKSMSEVIIPDTFTLHNSSLVINTVGNPTLGEYTCVYSTDGVTTKFTSTDVTFQEEVQRTGLIVVVVLFVLTSCIVVLLIVFHRRRRLKENNSKGRQGTTAGKQQQQQQQQLLKPTKKVTEEELKDWCKKVIISKDQTRATHDGIVKRLKEASEKEVDIQRIILRDSFTSVEDNGKAINLSSGTVLPPLKTLKILNFENEKWQQWDLTKLTSIMQYACHRSPPTEIGIERILLPFEFENKLSTLQQKPYVEWVTDVVSTGLLHLNYDTEQWENTPNGPLNKSLYYVILKKFEKEKANGEVKQEAYEEVKQEAYEEVKQEAYEEVKQEAYENVEEKAYENVKEEAYEEVTDQTERAKLLEDSDHKQSPSDVKV